MRWRARQLEQTVPICYAAAQHAVCPGIAVLRHRRWRRRLAQSDFTPTTGPISAQAMRGSGGLFPWASAQTERVQDWLSLERHEDIRVNLTAHAANTTCPLLANPKIPGRTLHPTLTQRAGYARIFLFSLLLAGKAAVREKVQYVISSIHLDTLRRDENEGLASVQPVDRQTAPR